MSIRSTFGIDGFDLAIHVGITCMLMIVVGSAANGPDGDGVMAGLVAVSLGVLAWRRQRGLKRMGPDTGEVRFDRLQELEGRVADLEIQQGRVLELEERLDFAERMLTQQREASHQVGAIHGRSDAGK